MEKKKGLWPVLPLIIIAFSAILAWFWPVWKVYLAPKTVLTSAIADTYDALTQRMEHSPAVLIAGVLDTEQGNSADITVDTENKLLGSVQYDMNIQIQWNPQRILAQGRALTQGKPIDLSVYLDKDFAALSSAGILQGKYYGLTYDTFSSDIRSSPMLAMMIGESKLKQWESGIQLLRSHMERTLTIPKISLEDMRGIFLGILALPAEVDREGVYFEISFEATGEQIAAGMELLSVDLPVSLAPGEDVEVSFWLKDGKLLRIRADGEELELDVLLGSNPVTDDITIRYENRGQITAATISTQQDADTYRETVTVQGAKPITVSYQWQLDTGELQMDITRAEDTSHLDMNLKSSDRGFVLSSQDFEGLMQVLLGTKDTGDSPCTLAVTQGASIETPAYKNFVDWTLDDLATLLGGIGGLFGFKIQ